MPEQAPTVILEDSVVQACAGAQEIYEQALRRATAASEAVTRRGTGAGGASGTEVGQEEEL